MPDFGSTTSPSLAAEFASQKMNFSGMPWPRAKTTARPEVTTSRLSLFSPASSGAPDWKK